MIENILIVDTETTGLHPKKGAKIIEIACILYNIKHKSILQTFSTLFPCDENPVEDINKIKVDVTNCTYSNSFLINILATMLTCSDACVAHNASFDKEFLATLEGIAENFIDKKWICTMKNFTWPIALPRFRLEDICNGMRVPYVNAHRALSDCLLMVQCFDKVDDLEERFNRC